jgi:SpoVK/Ycf46/Vps4 family AAA+-type ATPase
MVNTFNIDQDLTSTSLLESYVTSNSLGINDMIRLWLFRLMVPLGGYKLLLRKNDFRDDDLAKALGFNDYFAGSSSIKYDQFEIKNQLFNDWESAEKNKVVFEFKNAELERNLKSLSNLVGLNKTELAMVMFAVCVHNNQILENACSMLGTQNIRTLVRVFGICLDTPEPEIRKALHPGSLLSTSGILSVDSSSSYDFYNKIELLKGLVDLLEMHHENPSEIFRNILQIAPTSKLQESDYPHLEKDISIIKQYLQQALTNKNKGVNFLIYGIPGTGKTEFARMISFVLHAKLYEINSGSKGVEPLDEDDRFRAYSLGQILCARQSQSIILFDEVENIFKAGGTQSKDNEKFNSKAWMNHVLENNPVPTFWISNDISDVDPAFIRRFDYVLEIKAPPRSLREKLLSDYLEDLPVSQGWKKQMAENEALVPAIIERSAKVVRMSGVIHDKSGTEEALQSILSNTIEAMGYSRPKPASVNKTFNYRLDVLNTNQSLENLCRGLQLNKEARICLYGPSGTGKTAFGKYIAEILDLPLLAKRASDIVSPYVGVTEQNMARMFEEARQEKAVLMLDEADTFLTERSNAQHSWEVSAVNEMLTQMESFDGLFIASTNYMDMIDSAAMRRFDIKLKFDYMKPAQVKIMFAELAQQYALTVEPPLLMLLEKMEHITPGDFAAVRRKLRLMQIVDANALLIMLEEECLFKPESVQRKIGFH